MPPTTIHLILSPHHLGVPSLAVGAGPYHILSHTSLIPRLESAGHTVHITEIPRVASTAHSHIGEIGRSFEILRRVSRAVRAAREDGAFALILAGNCNNSVGVAAGYGLGRGGEVGGAPGGDVVWFDAHPDFDTPGEMETGYFDVSAVAMLGGTCWGRFLGSVEGFGAVDLRRLVYVGLRDYRVEQGEKVRGSGVGVVWGGEGLRREEGFVGGLERVLGEKEREFGNGDGDGDGKEEKRPCLVHFDVDCLDTSVGIANFAAAPGGLSMEDAKGCMRVIRERRRVVAMTVASFDPSYDGADAIAEAAAQAVLSLLE